MTAASAPGRYSRLCGAPGGIYFITRLGAVERITFDRAGMREYKPDWTSRATFLTILAKNPLRQAVIHAAQITQQDLPARRP